MVLSLNNAEFGWDTSISKRENNLTFGITQSPKGSLIMVVGPVGCGKSTFLKSLIGEVPLREGEIYCKYPDVAFCDQPTWIINASIQDNITAHSPHLDDEWYSSVIHACALDTDLEQMPRGHDTIVGSHGSMLSGGQKQRLVSEAFLKSLGTCSLTF